MEPLSPQLWLAWEAVDRAIEAVLPADPAAATASLRDLAHARCVMRATLLRQFGARPLDTVGTG